MLKTPGRGGGQGPAPCAAGVPWARGSCLRTVPSVAHFVLGFTSSRLKLNGAGLQCAVGTAS